jgi:hypothetical protein
LHRPIGFVSATRAHPAALSLLAVWGAGDAETAEAAGHRCFERQDGEAVYRTNVSTSGVLPVLYTNQYVGQHLRQN